MLANSCFFRKYSPKLAKLAKKVYERIFKGSPESELPLKIPTLIQEG